MEIIWLVPSLGKIERNKYYAYIVCSRGKIMTETWIKYSTAESKYGGEIVFYRSVEQLHGYPRVLRTVVTDADHRIVKVEHKWYNPEIRNYQTTPCGTTE
jgi:hypothetical protein